ncbi:hypothetical protein Tco_1345417 [Tanacetum coccineum]
MGDKHLDTSKDSLESSVKDPVPIPSESNDTSNGAWNLLLNDDKFQTALNDCYTPLNPLRTPHMEDEHLDIYTIPESKSIESLLNEIRLIDSSHLKIMIIILESFSCEPRSLTIPIPRELEKADFDLEEEIPVLFENLLYDNVISSTTARTERKFEIG